MGEARVRGLRSLVGRREGGPEERRELLRSSGRSGGATRAGQIQLLRKGGSRLISHTESVNLRDGAANEADRHDEVGLGAAQVQFSRAARGELRAALDQDTRARDVDQLQLRPPRKLDARQPGHFPAPFSQRDTAILRIVVALLREERAGRVERFDAATRQRNLTRGVLGGLVVREHRRVFNPELARARQAVGNLRGHHATIVLLQSEGQRSAIEHRSEESTPTRLLRRRVDQHVEGGKRQHLNVRSGVELLHVRQQLGLVWR